MGSSPGQVINPPVPPDAAGNCPAGYVLNPTDGLCYIYTIKTNITETGVKLPDVDPRNAAQLSGLGEGDSGLPERQAIAHWHGFKRAAYDIETAGKLPQSQTGVVLAKGDSKIGRTLGGFFGPLVWAYLTWYDGIVSVIAAFLSEAKTRDNPSFWNTIGEVITDLLGVEVDGLALYEQMKAKGTIAGMQGIGAGLINLLIGEFTGTATGTGGQINAIPTPDTDTGLPAATLTPRGGILAAQALMGFVLSSSIRQANVEGLTEKIPYGYGAIFEKYSEAMRTNLGIGKMLRFALRPIFQELVATPLKWAMNMEYRPTRFNAAEAARARWSGVYDQDAFLAEAAQLGYTEKRAFQLLDEHTRRVDLNRLLILRAVGTVVDSDFDNFLGRDGYDPTHAAYTRTASDLEPARRVALALAEHYLLEFGKGNIITQTLKDFIDGLKAAGFLLTPGEVAGLEAVANHLTVNAKLRRRQLSPLQLHKAYIDGTITLVEYEDHLTGLGYSADDVQILGIEVLLDAKKAQAAAAKKAAAKKTGNTTAALTPPGGTPVA